MRKHSSLGIPHLVSPERGGRAARLMLCAFTAALLLLWFGGADRAAAQALSYSFTSFDAPGATATAVNAINDAARMVGQYTDSSGLQHGFVLQGTTFKTLDVTGAA